MTHIKFTAGTVITKAHIEMWVEYIKIAAERIENYEVCFNAMSDTILKMANTISDLKDKLSAVDNSKTIIEHQDRIMKLIAENEALISNNDVAVKAVKQSELDIMSCSLIINDLLHEDTSSKTKIAWLEAECKKSYDRYNKLSARFKKLKLLKPPPQSKAEA